MGSIWIMVSLMPLTITLTWWWLGPLVLLSVWFWLTTMPTLFVIVMLYRHVYVPRQFLKFYECQDGVVVLPSAKTCCLGNAGDLGEYGKVVEKKKPIVNPFLWLIEKYLESERGSNTTDEDEARTKVYVLQVCHKGYLVVQDPDMVQDLNLTKVAHVDKTVSLRDTFFDLTGDAFLFSLTDKLWKEKRTACAHMFYKDKMQSMFQVMKQITQMKIEEYRTKIQAERTRWATIDMTDEMDEIFARIIMQISFGVDVSHDNIVIEEF